MAFWDLLFNLSLDARGFAASDIGAVRACANFAPVLLALPAARLAARFPLRPLLVIFQTIIVAAYGAALFATSPGAIEACVFVGAGASVLIGATSGMFFIRNAPEKERAAAFSAQAIATYLGSVGGNALAAALSVTGYRCAISIGLLMTLSSVLAFAKIQEAPRPVPARASRTGTSLGRRNWRYFGRVLSPKLLVAVGSGCAIQFLALFLRDRFGASDPQIGGYMSVEGALMVVGLVFSPYLARRFGRVRTIVVSQLLSVPFMVAAGLTGSLAVATLSLLARNTLMDMSSPLGEALIFEVCDEEDRPYLGAVIRLATDFVWTLTALSFGSVLHGNYTLAFLGASILYGIAAVMFYAFFRRYEPESPRERPLTVPTGLLPAPA